MTSLFKIMSTCYKRVLNTLRNRVLARLSLQYRSNDRNYQEYWQNLINMACYYLLTVNGLCYYQDRDNYPIFIIIIQTIVVIPYIMISMKNPNNYGEYCIPVISIINLTTMDILSQNYKTIQYGMIYAMLASFIFFQLLLHAKLWINGVTITNAIFAPLLNLHILCHIHLCLQYYRNSLYLYLLISIIIIIIHFNNIFNGQLIGFKNDLLFFISSILFINLTNMIHIAASYTFNQILFIIITLHCGIICVFGVSWEFTLLTLPSFNNKISIPYILCIFFGFGFENICIIIYWYQLYYLYLFINYKYYIIYLFIWIFLSIPCILPFICLWYFRIHVICSSSQFGRGKSQFHPHHKWIINDFINKYIMIDRIYCIIHCASCKFSQFGDLFRTNNNDQERIRSHKPFDPFCLKNQKLFTQITNNDKRLLFIDEMLNKSFGKKLNIRNYISLIILLFVMKIISYLLCLMVSLNSNNNNDDDNNKHLYLWNYLIEPILYIYSLCLLPYLYNLCIIGYDEYYYSYIWFISSHSMFVDKTRVERFCNQLQRNRIIWQIIEPDIIASKIIQFLQYDFDTNESD